MEEITRERVIETLIAVGIVAAAFILTRILSALLRRIVHAVTHATDTAVDAALIRAIRRPLMVLVLAQGVFIGLRTLSYLDPHRNTLERAWIAISLLLVIWLVQGVAMAGLDLYARRAAAGDGAGVRFDRALPMIRRSTNVLIVAIGLLMVLGELGISISPLLAGLGIGGLAVALALQPMLANVFAGGYVMSDGSIRVGDFIELRDGPQGWVEDIGWRATRLLDFDNNRVIVPNSALAEAIVTNYSTETEYVDVRVVCGVSYESDLDVVERASLEVLQSVVDDIDTAVKERQPFFMFTAFGDSNIDMLLKIQAINRVEVATLEHEVRKRLHRRFAAEGITINYPARRLMLSEEDTPGLARLHANGAHAADEGASEVATAAPEPGEDGT